MSRLLATITLGVVLGMRMFVASDLVAEESAPAEKPTIQTGQAAIEAALDKPISLDFKEAPLTDVVDYLRDAAKVEILLDQKALDDIGVGSDTPITRHLHTLPLRSALNRLLNPIGLTWTIKDDVLLITNEDDEVECMLVTKVYDVADLVACKDREGKLCEDYDSLIELITTTVKPGTWDSVGGPGSIAPAACGTARALVVLQTYQVQCEITNLLADIRKVAAKTPDRELSTVKEPKKNNQTIPMGSIGGSTGLDPTKPATKKPASPQEGDSAQ